MIKATSFDFDNMKSIEGNSRMELTEFRAAIFEKLQRSGVVESITAKLRRTVVEVLMENDDHPKHQENVNSFDLESVALRSLVMEFLIVDGMVNTQIVFATESGLNGNILSREDAIKSFDIRYDSVANKCLRKNKEINDAKEMSGKNNAVQGMKSSTLYELLLCISELFGRSQAKSSASSQTSLADSDLRARRDLDEQLRQIDEKYQKELRDNNVEKINTVTALEAKMISFQKECEGRCLEKMRQELDQLKRNEINSMRKEESAKRQKEINALRSMLKAEYDLKIQQSDEKEEQLDKSFKLREKELEFVRFEEIQPKLQEIECLKQKLSKAAHALELEKRNVQLEEQRVEHVLKTAEMNLDSVEKKEVETRKRMSNEYERLRSNAKKTYDDATDAVKKQNDVYTRELKELNNYRQSMSESVKELALMEKEMITLKVDKDYSELLLKKEQSKAKELLLATTTNDCSQTEQIAYVKRICDLEGKLRKVKEEMILNNEREESRTFAFEREKRKIKKEFAELNDNLQKEMMRIMNLQSEKDLALDEIKQLRKLLEESQGALGCIRHKGNNNSFPIGIEYGEKRFCSYSGKNYPVMTSIPGTTQSVVSGSDPMFISNEQNIDQICNHVAKKSYESPTMVKEKNKIEHYSKIELGSNGLNISTLDPNLDNEQQIHTSNDFKEDCISSSDTLKNDLGQDFRNGLSLTLKQNQKHNLQKRKGGNTSKKCGKNIGKGLQLACNTKHICNLNLKVPITKEVDEHNLSGFSGSNRNLTIPKVVYANERSSDNYSSRCTDQIDIPKQIVLNNLVCANVEYTVDKSPSTRSFVSSVTSEGLESNYDAASFTPEETRKVFVMKSFCHQHNEIEQKIIDKSTNLDSQTKKLRLALAPEQSMKIESSSKLNSDIKKYDTEFQENGFTVISDIKKVETMNDVGQDSSCHIIEITKCSTELKADIKVLNDPNNQSKIKSMIVFDKSMEQSEISKVIAGCNDNENYSSKFDTESTHNEIIRSKEENLNKNRYQSSMDNLIGDESVNIESKRIAAANSIQLILKRIFHSQKNKVLSRKASLQATSRKGVIDETKVAVLSNAQILRNHELHFNEIGKPFKNNYDSKSFNKGTEAKSGCEESCSNCDSPLNSRSRSHLSSLPIQSTTNEDGHLTQSSFSIQIESYTTVSKESNGWW